MPPSAAAAPKKKRPGDEAKKAIEATRKKLKEPEVRESFVGVCAMCGVSVVRCRRRRARRRERGRRDSGGQKTDAN